MKHVKTRSVSFKKLSQNLLALVVVGFLTAATGCKALKKEALSGAAGATSSGGGSGSGGSGGSSSNTDSLTALNDEFDGSASMSDWQDLGNHDLNVAGTHYSDASGIYYNNSFLSGVPSAADNASGYMSGLAGSLVMIPRSNTPGGWSTSPANESNAWYSDESGPFLFKRVTASKFVVMTRLRVGIMANGATAPGVNGDASPPAFNAVGFVIRSNSSAFTPVAITGGVNSGQVGNSVTGAERWVMYNLGYQDTSFASEVKSTTVDDAGDAYNNTSRSRMYLNPVSTATAGYNSGYLLVCVVDGVFRFYKKLDSDSGSSWIQERVNGSTATNVGHWGGTYNAITTEALNDGTQGIVIDRSADLANTSLQVGLIANNYRNPSTLGNRVRGEFDFVRFKTISSAAECTTALAVP
ncbi:MAG: hypothetical protein AB1540_06920 [Bdellovibrionota bacterium]